MILAGQSIENAEKTYAIGLVTCCALSALLLAALLHELGLSPVPLFLVVVAVGLFWLAFRHPVGCVGAFLAFMPLFPIAFLLAKFFGPSYVGQLEGIDRVVLLLLTCILWWRNGIKLVLPDWLLLIAFGIAVLRLPLDGSLLQTASDFSFVIAYAAGRVIGLTVSRQTIWANRAVWIVAAVSVLGLGEVFVLGPGPRTVLYLKSAEAFTDNGVALNASFRATGFTGLRVSGTMVGPLQFAPLCMAALIIWWVYSRKPLLGGAIALGLIGSLTRSAWVGTALAVLVLAIGLGQAKRFVLYAALGLGLFAASIPILGIGGYLSSVAAGEDTSTGQHQDSLLEGLTFVASHPIGIGSANFGRQTGKDNPDAIFFENAYLTLAGAYGIPVSLCVLGFLYTALRVSWRLRTQLGYTAAAMVGGFGAVLMFVSLHDVFPLACWIWIPVGLAITSSLKQGPGQPLPATIFDS